MPPPEPPSALRGVVRDLHHIAIAVPDLAEARPLYEAALGLPGSEVEHVAGQQVNVLVLSAGGQRIELIEPAGSESPISRFLDRRGQGLHHLAWRVDDCAAALVHLAGKGIQLIHDTPQPGSHGTRVAFLHPKSTGGVLMEIVEDPAEEPHE